MELIFERSRPGRGSDLLPPPDVPASPLPEAHRRAAAPRLPEVAESEVSRHYQAMARHALRRVRRVLSSGLLYHEV